MRSSRKRLLFLLCAFSSALVTYLFFFTGEDMISLWQHIHGKDTNTQTTIGKYTSTLLIPKETEKVAAPPLTMHCAPGRLGNQIGLFATLYGVAQLNGRKVALLKCHLIKLDHYFNLSSFPVIDELDKRVGYALGSYFQPKDRDIPVNATIFVGHSYPVSYTFYDHAGSEIRQLLKFRYKFQKHAETILHTVAVENKRCKPHGCVFVGIHVRLSDYEHYMTQRKGRGIDIVYFHRAMDLYRKKFPAENVLFLVVSDNRRWCKKNFKTFSDVVVAPEVTDPGYDMAIMTKCNHSIISYGTFSFWSAYLREAQGGETVRFDDYILPGSWFLVENPYNKVYPSHWIPITSTPINYWRNFSATQEDGLK